MKKQSDLRGRINRKEILDFIKSHSSKDWTGVHVDEIVKHVHVSRMTVTTHLNDLVSEDKIRKTRRGTYLPKEIFDDLFYDGWSYLEDYLTLRCSYVVSDVDILDMEGLAEIVRGLLKNDKITMKEFIFEFANRIGAYILYVFIESLRTRRNVKSEGVRFALTEKFLKEAIPLMDLLREFLYSLPIDSKEKGYYELNQGTFNKLSEVYNDLYPNIAKSIEENYQLFCNSLFQSVNDYVIKRNSNCSHKWEKILIHKIGDLYRCRICNRIVSSLENTKS